MSITARILALPENMHSRVVAEIVGCTRVYVNAVRCRHKNPDLYRSHYHRNKVLGGPDVWTPKLDKELNGRIKRGQSYGVIAKAMGFSRSSIAGRLRRLKKAA